MAAMKKSIWSNIIKMKLTLREMLLELSPAVVSCWDETKCVGSVHNISSMCVAEFGFLTENLDSGC